MFYRGFDNILKGFTANRLIDWGFGMGETSENHILQELLDPPCGSDLLEECVGHVGQRADKTHMHDLTT